MRFARYFSVLLVTSAFVSPTLFAAVVLERLEASVNSDTILKSDLSKFRRTLKLRAQLDPLFSGTPLAAKGESANDAEIIEFLVDERMITQAFPLTDAEVEQEVNTIQANNNITREQLRTALAGQGFNFDEYFELIRIGAAKRNLIDREIRTRVSISDDDIRNYYTNHYSKGKEAPKSYQLRIITLNSRANADAALNMVKSGQPFEEVAKNVSQDASAAQGGELPPLSEEQLSPMIREQLKKLTPGNVSDVFTADQKQFAILKLVDAKTSDDTQMKALENEIRGALATGEYQRQLQLWLERQRQLAFIHHAGQSMTQNLLKR